MNNDPLTPKDYGMDEPRTYEGQPTPYIGVDGYSGPETPEVIMPQFSERMGFTDGQPSGVVQGLMIDIRTLPHALQRYRTVGDWYARNGCWRIRVSKLPDWRYELLVAVHELVEMSLCRHAGITEGAVTEFDTRYEANRRRGDTTSEPGDSPKAPYHAQHVCATTLEQQLAWMLGVDWAAYSAAVEAL